MFGFHRKIYPKHRNSHHSLIRPENRQIAAEIYFSSLGFMKQFLIILLLFFSNGVFAQINDGFDDSDFSLNPSWVGSNSGNDFVIIDNKLRSNSNTANSSFYLSTENTLAINTQWEFWVNLQFSTSGSNYVDVYILSDKGDLKNTLINGYFVRIGNTDDEISLYKRSGLAGSSVKIIDGVNGSVGATNNTVKIRLKRDSAGNFTLEREIVAIGSTYFTEGNVTDLTHVVSSHFGILIQQSTATFFLKHFFDNIKISSIVTDIIPPVVNTVSALDTNTLAITFSEAMDSVSSKIAFNYLVNGNAGPVVKVLTTNDPARYLLKLMKSLNTGNYLVTANNVKDKNGNLINNNNAGSFNYIKPYVVKFGDIMINEIFADPSPQIDLPSVEFAELWNNTSEILSLKNWKFSDSGSSATFGDVIIAPQSFLIICAKADTAEYKTFGKVLGLAPWPSLNNSGELIKLTNSDNLTIDSVRYSDTWYRSVAKKQGGWTLERKHPNTKCEAFLNWYASVDSAGGTPGRANSIYHATYDIMPLRADSLKQISDTTIRIYFNKSLNSSTISIENITLIPSHASIKKVSTDLDFRELVITYDRKFLDGTQYALTMKNLRDCFGVPIANTPGDLSFKTLNPILLVERLDTSRLVFTEIFADPSPEIHLPLVEFVEIYNPSNDTVNLDKWTLNDPSTKTTIRGQKILPKEYLILCPVADTSLYKFYGPTVGLSPWPSLNNSGDQIVLKSYKGRTVDSLTFSDSWYHTNSKKGGGWSIEKIDVNSICEDLFNWTASIDTNGGTPGRKNSVYISNYDILPLQADSLKLLSDTTLKIFFNKHLNAATLIAANFNLLPNNSIKKITADSELREVSLTYSNAFKAGFEYQMILSNLKDCSGQFLKNSFPLKFKTSLPPPPIPERIDTAKILITEIFADPSPEIHLPLVEFIEIYNPSNDIVDLDKWTISDPTTKANIRGRKILPLEYVIFCPEADTASYKTFGKTVGISPWPSLNNSADQITLKSFKNRIVDSIAYSDVWYHSTSKKTGGWSLEKIDLNSVCSEVFNWTASIDTNGGTPGKKNSVDIIDYDKIALKADSLKLLSDTTVKLYFNKHLNAATLIAENLKTIPSNAIKKITSDPDYKEVILTYGMKFQTGTEYQIFISNIEDCSRNKINNPLPLNFKTPAPPAPIPEKIDTAKILITEIFADPSPEIHLPLVEFIEIYNPSNDIVDLDKWTISDPTTKANIRGRKILPLEYVILCPEADTASYKTFGKTIGINPWPSLK